MILTSSKTYNGITTKKETGEVLEVYSNQGFTFENHSGISDQWRIWKSVKYTEKIEDQKTRSWNIAWIQSHVELPLFRIMGLIDLMTNVEIESDEDERKLRKI
jgi:hypothetical protein